MLKFELTYRNTGLINEIVGVRVGKFAFVQNNNNLTSIVIDLLSSGFIHPNSFLTYVLQRSVHT
jgi:hypothetical protein